MSQAVADLIEQGATAHKPSKVLPRFLFKAEMAGREVRSIACHLKIADFPADKDLSGFDLSAREFNEATVGATALLRVHGGRREHRPDGGPSTGKTHVATGLGIQAIEHHGRKARFFSTIELVSSLEQEKARGRAGILAETLIQPDLVILDELGYLPISIEALSSPIRVEQALRTHQRHHHHQSQLQQTGHGFWRCQDDHRAARSPDPPPPHS